MVVMLCQDGLPILPAMDFQFFNQTNPDVHLCFHDIVLTSIPSGFLFIFVIPYLMYLSQMKAYSAYKWSYLAKAKMALTVVAFVCCFAELLTSVILDQDDLQYLWPSHYIRIGLLVLSFTFVIIIVPIEHKKQVHASMCLFVFWLLLMFVEAFRIRALVLLEVHQNYKSQFFFYNTIALTTTALLQLLIYGFIAEKTPETKIKEKACKDALLSGEPQQRLPGPADSSSVISRLTFWWTTWLLVAGWRKELAMVDLCDLLERDKPLSNQRTFDRHFKKSHQKKDPKSLKYEVDTLEEVKLVPTMEEKKSKRNTRRFLGALWNSFGAWFMYAGFLKLLHDCILFTSPMLLRALIGFFTGPPAETGLTEYPIWYGFAIVFGMFAGSVFQTSVLHQYFYIVTITGVKVRSAIITAVFSKTLSLTNAARQKTTTAETVNLVAIDAQYFQEVLSFLHIVWSGLAQIIVAIALLYLQMGPAVFAGVGILLLLLGCSTLIARYQKVLQVQKMKKKDERLKMTNEVISGMRVIKFFAWEPSFEEKIEALREEELRILRNMAVLSSAGSIIWNAAPPFVALTSFAVYSMNHQVTASVVFVSLALFQVLRFPMIMFPMVISNIVQTSVSAKRIAKFLALEELQTEAVERSSENPCGDACLCIQRGTFAWDNEGSPCLEDVNFSVPTGSLVAVVGAVGAGKSSLISALLGELQKRSGAVNIRGSVAYVPQQAWIQNATVKDNILFGATEKGSKYDAVLEACSLTSDLEVLQNGEETEIGEKGINLSGGQKQRISLARAAFADADIYLLDDPLSAVDSYVAAHLFKEVIGPSGVLRNKTRIWVTHRLNMLSQCDHILMLEHGRVVDQGKFEDLRKSCTEFKRLIEVYTSEEDHHKAEETLVNPKKTARSISKMTNGSSGIVIESDTPASAIGSKKAETEKLVKDEKIEVGTVSLAVFVAYAKSLGYCLTAVVFLCFILCNVARIGSDLSLAKWTDAQAEESKIANSTVKNLHYLGIYGGLVCFQSIFVFLGTVLLAFGVVRSARYWHKEMLTHITHGFMSFFEATPIGRILNRFSKDIDVIDVTLRDNIVVLMATLLTVVCIILVISVKLPPFLIAVVPLAIGYVIIQRIFVSTTRQLKRLESTTRSPIISHLSETVQGVSSIRAYQREEQFTTRCVNLLEENMICTFWGLTANRWLAVRLEFIGTCIIVTSGCLCVLMRDTIPPGEVGLILVYALGVTQTLTWLVRMLSDLETNIIAVERVKEYTELPQEAAWVVEPGPPAGWPSQGRIRFENFSLKYRPELELILRDITLDVAQGEKVGVVGRTGSGKSTLMLSLFRLVEPTSGRIFIDDVDITSVGLHQLRGKITIIPQDPTLFTGTVRFNMDPFNEAEDDAIWTALEHVQMKAPIDALEGKLYAPVTEAGENFSVGQRQLLCMARALLRKTKVLVMDEATAAVDLDTDALIQTTIRKEFTDCTVLTIAHRLDTVIDYDKILVLDSGVVKEYDSPDILLQDKTSHFHGMCKVAGILPPNFA